MLILGIFFKVVLGGGGGLCCVWWGFVEGFEFFFPLLLRFLDLELVGGSGDCGCNLCRVVVVVVVVPVVPGWWRLSLSCVFVYCWFLNKYIILIPCIYYFNL